MIAVAQLGCMVGKWLVDSRRYLFIGSIFEQKQDLESDSGLCWMKQQDWAVDAVWSVGH